MPLLGLHSYTTAVSNQCGGETVAIIAETKSMAIAEGRKLDIIGRQIRECARGGEKWREEERYGEGKDVIYKDHRSTWCFVGSGKTEMSVMHQLIEKAEKRLASSKRVLYHVCCMYVCMLQSRCKIQPFSRFYIDYIMAMGTDYGCTKDKDNAMQN